MKKYLILLTAVFSLFALACETKSGRAQSCGSSSECKSGLLCIDQICIQNDYPVSTEAKECKLIECETTKDCCGDRDEDDCFYACEEQKCSYKREQCQEDDDCRFINGGLCESGRCVQCKTTADCADEEDICVEGRCIEGCKVDDECPVFNNCQAGQCVHVGCVSDRECILYSRNADAKCEESKDEKDKGKKSCSIPCEENAECGTLNVCEDGECKFLGCETDTDCRAYHRDTNSSGPGDFTPRSVCVDLKK